MSDRFAIPKDPLVELRFMCARGNSSVADWPALLYETYLARNAIFIALKALGIAPGDQVLVPAYLCTAAISPILSFGATIGFYRVGSHCEVDFDDVKRRVTSKTKAVLVVHYFGFPQPMMRLKALCENYGVALIEDCAHVLRGSVEGVPMGSIGDVSVFSWRKFLPLYAGGGLMLNKASQKVNIEWTQQSPLLFLREVKTGIERMTRSGKIPLIDALRRAVAGVGRVRPLQQDGRDQTASVAQGDEFDARLANMPMPRLAQWLRAHSDIGAIVAARRKNFQYLLERMPEGVGLAPLFRALPVGACPLIFPLLWNGVPNVHHALRQLGIPAVTWGGVRHAAVPKDEFQQADLFYDHLVHLPVHQSLGVTELDLILESVRTVLTNSRTQVATV